MSTHRLILGFLAASTWLAAGCITTSNPPPADTCSPGESFLAADACNTCECPESGLTAEAICTQMVCVYDPCAEAACGDPCTECDPSDPDCNETGVVKACNAAGACVADTGDLCADDLCKDVVCEGTEGFCEGSVAIGGSSPGTCDPQTGECGPGLGAPPWDCASEGLICEAGVCVEGEDLCKDVVCPELPPACNGDYTHVACANLCEPETGQCVPTYSPQQDCAAEGLICVEGECVKPPDLCADVVCPGYEGKCEEGLAFPPLEEGYCNPETGLCEELLWGEPADCAELGLVCEGGFCVEESATCDPMKAKGEGPCAAELGFTWNGKACFSISGCECVGADCDALFPDAKSCEAAYADCLAGWSPCDGASCGAPCTLCDPKDKDCVETAVEKACTADGACVAMQPGMCSEAISPTDCANVDGLAKNDPYQIDDATVDGDTLVLTVSYSGGCEEHVFSACYGAVIPAGINKMNLSVNHDSNNDLCEAYITEKITIDLLPLKAAYIAETGDKNGPIGLLLAGWPEQVFYALK